MAKDGLRFLGYDESSVNCTCDLLDKNYGAFQYVQYMFDRTNRMFTYTGLPETIPDYMLEYMLQIYGAVAIIEHKGSLFAVRANFGGPPDPYYRPTQAVIANPALNISGTYKIINYLPPFERVQWTGLPSCVRVVNDTQFMGLLPLFTRYASQMVENDISIRSAQINSRQQTVISVDNGPEIQSAQQYMSDIEAGKLAVIGKRPFLDGVSVTNASVGQSNAIIQLIELQQYLKASWYNEIGLNSNFNMKRQYLSRDEIHASADILLPLIDNMLNCRVDAIERINETFGMDITVEKDSSWEKKQLQSDLSLMPEGTTVDLESGEMIVPNGIETKEEESGEQPSNAPENSGVNKDNTTSENAESSQQEGNNETPNQEKNETSGQDVSVEVDISVNGKGETDDSKKS